LPVALAVGPPLLCFQKLIYLFNQFKELLRVKLSGRLFGKLQPSFSGIFHKGSRADGLYQMYVTESNPFYGFKVSKMEQFQPQRCGTVFQPGPSIQRGPMEIKKMERLIILCQQAMREDDSDKLVELVQEINQMFEETTIPIPN
jgi:hypothetical protein